MPTLRDLLDPVIRDRLSQARDAYLDDRNNDCVVISVDVLVEMLRADPDALEGTRLEAKNFRNGFPNLGVTLHERGTSQLHATYDGREYTMSEAIYYYEYALEAATLVQRKADATGKETP